MEKVLELYKYIDGVNDTPFPSSDEHLVVRDFRYDAKRMGGAPTITFTVMHRLCLDNLWGKDVYAFFNGERYYIKQTPTSSYSNSDTKYKHEVELISERAILDNIYFYDVVARDDSVDKPVSNSSKFTFFGDIEEYVTRLNYSLKWSNVDYSIVIDEGVTSEEKQVTFEDKVVTNALQEIYNIYQIPYYFVGKVIHIGEYQNNVDHIFKYGSTNSLLSISKNNSNAKIVNRITGVGSQDNIPYYYPNDDEKGVTKPLLNGSSSGVSISNQSRYRKVRLSDKFVFYRSIQTQTPLIDSSIYTLGDLTFDKKEEGKDAQYSVDFYYTFSLDDGENVLFEVSSDDESTVSLRYEIYKTSGNHLGYFSGNNTISLTKGTYNFIVRWTFLHPEVMFGVEEQLESLISTKLNIDASIVVDSKQTWTLKDIPVVLDKYGISVNNPSNGDVITIQQVSYINPQPFLMPYVYRKQGGNERFYNAENNTYRDENGEYYVFENEYSKNHPSEHIENFDDIKPTIKNVTNASGFRIDRFVDFAYDLYDNDEVDEEGKFIHKYFFAKLNKLDGENGFNLFDHAIDESEMVVSMTSGSCGSCSFKVMVNKDTQKNTVQVDEYGNLLRDSNGNVRFGSPQDRQNDTENYEVWIALEKDIDTFGVLMPNATNKYRPIAGDTFVILHIDLPKSYIEAAEKRLEEKLIKYMYDNNFEKFNFSIAFSRIFFAENPSILDNLNENSQITIEYNGHKYSLYVSSISFVMSKEQPLPEVKVELNENISISQNQISQIVESTKKDILSKTTKDVFWGDIKGVPSWIGSEKPRYSYSELSGRSAVNDSNGIWVIKKDDNGNDYVYTTLDIVTQKGLSMYHDTSNLDLPSIYDGLPIDMDTLSWELDEKGKKLYLKAKVGEGNGSFGEIETIGEGNAITKVEVIEGGEGESDKLVFTKEKTFIDKELLEKDYLTKSYIEENYYTKKTTDETFFKKDDAEGLFVTLDETTQEILGVKTFKNGLNIGSSKIWQSQDDVVYVDANLVVRGGVTMYGLNKVDVPTIMAGVAVDDVTISKKNGYLEVIGGGGGSIEYPLSWSGFSSGSYDGTSAKTIYIPSKVSELTNDSNYAKASDLSKYLPLTGGTLTGDLTLCPSNANYGSTITFGDAGYAYIAEDEDDHLSIYARTGINMSSGSDYAVEVGGRLRVHGIFTAKGTYAFMPKGDNGYGLYFKGCGLMVHSDYNYYASLGEYSIGEGCFVFASTPKVSGVNYLADRTWVNNNYLSLSSGGTVKGNVTMASGTTLYVETIRSASGNWMMGGNNNIAFGGNYTGYSTTLSGATLKLYGGATEKINITSSSIVAYSSSADVITLKRTTTGGGAFVSYKGMNQSNLGWAAGVSSGHEFVWLYYTDGSIANGTIHMTLDKNANLLVKGGVTMYGTSDQRLKQNIRTFSASEELMKLGGVYQFEYVEEEVKRNYKYKGTHFGLIYQNVKESSLSKMCMEREDGFGALNYLDTSFISLLAAVGMEHETRLQRLERENRELRMEVEQLKNK